MEAQRATMESDAECEVMMAEVIHKVADKRAEKIKLEGQAEGELAKVYEMERKYEYLNLKLNVTKNLGRNPNVKIYGNASDNAINQMAAYRLLHPKDFGK